MTTNPLVNVSTTKNGFKVKYKSPGKDNKIKSFSFATSTMSQERKKKVTESSISHILENKILPVTTSDSTTKSVKNFLLKELRRSSEQPINLSDKIQLKGNLSSSSSLTDTIYSKYDSSNYDSIDQPLPEDSSIFSPEEESANTKVIIAPSYSGKTTLLVNELLKLATVNDGEDLEAYSKIIMFTESPNSTPLKKLEANIKLFKGKLKIYDRYVPSIVKKLTVINSHTDNRFLFLVIYDDVLDLSDGTIMKSILTLRNSNISTCILTQYFKILRPAQRQSIHDIYTLKFGYPAWQYLVHDFIQPNLQSWLREDQNDPKAYDYNERDLTKIIHARSKDRLFHYSIRKDSIDWFKK